MHDLTTEHDHAHRYLSAFWSAVGGAQAALEPVRFCGDGELLHLNADNDVMLMGDHALTVIGQSVAQAFEALYFMERD